MFFPKQCTSILKQLVSWRSISFEIKDIRGIKRWVAPTLGELKRRKERLGPQPEQNRSTFLEWNYEAELYAFGKRLGEDFAPNLLKQALTDRSFVIQQMKQEQEGCSSFEESVPDNVDLIKHGEVFIKNSINNHFVNKYHDDTIKALHDHLTAEQMLAHVASVIGLRDIVLCASFPVDQTTLAKTFKAVVSALAQSTGDERAETFLKDFVVAQLNGTRLYDIFSPKNPYEYLLNWVKRKGFPGVEPRLCNSSAENTILANFQVGLYCDDKLLGIGWGESVEIAKDTAAIHAIEIIHGSTIDHKKYT